MASTNASAASNRMFSVPELAELIFTYVPIKDLVVNVPRVCRSWRTHTKNLKLQKAIFLKPEIEGHKTVANVVGKAESDAANGGKQDTETNAEVKEPENKIRPATVAKSEWQGLGFFGHSSPWYGHLSYFSSVPVRFNPFFLKERSAPARSKITEQELFSPSRQVRHPSVRETDNPNWGMLLVQPAQRRVRIRVSLTYMVTTRYGFDFEDPDVDAEACAQDPNGVSLGHIMNVVDQVAQGIQIQIQERVRSMHFLSTRIMGIGVTVTNTTIKEGEAAEE